MTRIPLFSGLVVDEFEHAADTAMIGDEPFYVIDDHGFRRHIPAEQVDRKVLELMQQQISGNEDLLSKQAAKMLGMEDIFSKAILENQFKNIEKQFDAILEIGIPEESRSYMRMAGFKIVIDFHGEVLRLEQPSTSIEGGEDGE